MAVVLGFGLIIVLALAHHTCLRMLNRVAMRTNRRPNAAVILTFIGLLALHTAEIAAFAFVYMAVDSIGWLGRVVSDGPFTYIDALTLSGITFSTLGYTDLRAEGALRIIVMMHSLGGFMILTWSATFLYSVWQRAFRE